MLAVVVADVGGEGEYQFERRKVGAPSDELHLLAQWLVQQEVEEVVMESTAQYWKPVWGALERFWKPERQKREGAAQMSGTLHLCQTKSNRGPRGRKNEFADGERRIKRLVAQELVLSFVPDPEQRLWRTVRRRKYPLTRDKVRFQNQREGLLEQAHIKLSSWVSDLLGLSARRMGKAQAEGEADPAVLAATFRRLLPRLGYKQAIWAIAHRLCRMLWKILHEGVHYEERGPAVSAKSQRTRTARMIKELQKLGYRVAPIPVGTPA